MLRLGPEGYYRFDQADKMVVNYTGTEANVCVFLGINGIPNEYVTKLPDNDIARCAMRMLKKNMSA